jgi:hypothetical protein
MVGTGMNRKTIAALVIGLLAGIGAGFVLSAWARHPAAVKGTAFLREFSFPGIAAQAGPANWRVMEDRIYEPFPSLARAPRIGRRIVAQAEMADGDFGLFTTKFDQAVREAFDKHQALNQAFFDLVHDSSRNVDNRPIRSRLHLPRRYYAIGDTHGVADIGYVSEAGRVTVIITLMEGP